jgi:hypothetical protein
MAIRDAAFNIETQFIKGSHEAITFANMAFRVNGLSLTITV